MNTLEIRPYDYILWRGETPQQLRDRLHRGINLSQMNYANRSLDPRALFCRAWHLDGSSITLVEIS